MSVKEILNYFREIADAFSGTMKFTLISEIFVLKYLSCIER